MSTGQREPDTTAQPESTQQSGFRKSAQAFAAGAPAPQGPAQRTPRVGPKPQFASFWQLLRARPLEGLRWLVRGGEHANYFHSPVRWLFGRDLLVHLRSIALYGAFGDELDHRDWMQARVDDLSSLPCEEGGFWFDYVADTGDGQLAMYDIASLLLSDLYVDSEQAGSDVRVNVNVNVQLNDSATTEGAPRRLPRGRCLFFGGDTAYHVADTATLENHVCAPFAWALAEARALDSAARPEHYAFGIPGNHDYYDSLIGFNRLFRANTPLLTLADFSRVQRASFVAVRLPFDFLFLGLDSQHGKLDRRQLTFMERCLAEYGTDRLIVSTPEPTTVFDSVAPEATQPFADLGLPRPFHANDADHADQHGSRAFPDPQQLHLDLSGDVHHYARYADPGHPNYASVVAGGGGAFVHPTHTSHWQPDAPWPPRAAARYPSAEQSRQLIVPRLLCPWRILSGGGVFLLGGLFSLLLYLGVALSPDLQPPLILKRAPNATSTWEVGSAVARNVGRVLDRDGSGETYRAQLTTAEWLSFLALLGVVAWASLASPKLFRAATARDESRRERVYATRYAPQSAAALLTLCGMAATYYVLSGAEEAPLRPFLANFLLLAYLAAFPLSLLWIANYLATLAKQAKLRVMHAIDSAPRWVAFAFGSGSAVFGLLCYGVNSVAAFATDLAALTALGIVAVAPMVFGYLQGAKRALRHKLGYLVLGALFGQLQLLLPLSIAVYGNTFTCLLAAAAAMAVGLAAAFAQRKWRSPWLMLGCWLLAGVSSLALALSAPSLRTINGASCVLAFAAGGTFACIWFGYYLAVALAFGAHNNEAGGAARADFYRHFVRFKLEPQRLTGYVIGFERPALSVRGGPTTQPTSCALRPRLVERFTLETKQG